MSMYSDHSGGVGDRASTRSINQAISQTQAWMVERQNRSTGSSVVSSLSTHSSKYDDLDLDSLFKRLDKYTAEMQEVEKRLKRARSNSGQSDGNKNLGLSFEDTLLSVDEGLSTQPKSSKTSTRRSEQRPTLSERLVEDQCSVPADASKRTPSRQSYDQSTSNSVPLSEPPPPISDGRDNALAALNEHSQPKEKQDIEVPPRILGDWKAWAEQQFPPTQQKQKRSSSKYSNRAASDRTSKKHGFVWRESSPAPPLKDARRTPSLQKSHVLGPGAEDEANSGQAPDEYLTEDDEPGPSVPSSWSLPPRSSSRKVMSNESLPPRSSSKLVMSIEQVQEEASVPAPAPRRRMTTTDTCTSIRNGGFWADHSISVWGQDDIPPIPALSASNSNATLKSSPPLTPLTISDPREDQVRRELETYSIQDGVEALERRYKKRRPPMLNLLDSDEEIEDFAPVPTPSEPEHSSALLDDDDRHLQPRPRRRKSIFSIFQRKSPVEKLIDMYMDDEPEEKPMHRRRSTWSRKGSPVREPMPKSPAIPPQFQQLHAKQTSL